MALRNIARLKILCPICGHSDWCMVTDDIKLALCQRIANDHPNKKGGWWHSLEEHITGRKEDFVTRIEKPKAPADILHAVYTDLFSLMPLSEAHRATLQQRGLMNREIREQGYGTLPINDRHKISRKLLDRYGAEALSAIPGFYMKDGPYGEFWTIFGGTGFMIPVRTIDKKIVGIQIRVDQPTSKTKYIWLSTDGKKNGTNSGNPVHVAVPPIIECNDIWITEGPLKANVIAWRKKCLAVAAPGIAHWSDIPELVSQLRVLLIHEGRNVIAYDSSEFSYKPWVKEYAYALADAMNRLNLQPLFATWGVSRGKGIDDVILANREPDFQNYQNNG